MKLRKVKRLSLKDTKKGFNKTMKSIKGNKILKKITVRGISLLTSLKKLAKK